MMEHDEVARWILGLAPEDKPDLRTATFLAGAAAVWPRVLSYSKREMSCQHLNRAEITSLAFEIWERVLRSVWKTFQADDDSAARIENLEHYLFGAFRHRLNRHLKQRRQYDSILDFRAPEDLEVLQLPGSVDDHAAIRLDTEIQLEQVYAIVGKDIRRAMIARIYGYSWAEIAGTMGTEEQNLIMRVQYAIRKFRSKLARARRLKRQKSTAL